VKSLFWGVLTGDARVLALVPANRIVEMSTLRSTVPKPFPFMTYSTTVNQRTGHGSGTSTIEVTAYDSRGSYDRIDDVLRAVRAAVADAGERTRVRTDGTTVKLVESVWLGEGPELNDPDLEANMRSTSFQLVGIGQ
jgi:hypothetical protein